jgi:uncharacterized protein YdhG (YjbR/CyaY superfamily)
VIQTDREVGTVSTVSEVEAYLGALPADRAETLRKVIGLIRAVAPHAQETMRYRMPTYELPGGMLCALASQKHYMSLYVDPKVVDAHREDLAGLSLGKSCIRFRRLEHLPLDTVQLILKEALEAREQVRE